MSDVLDADSVLSILAKRPQPGITRRRRLNPDCKEPRYAVATFQGQIHRKFPLDYSKQFGQPVPDWIWVEHPETIIALSNRAMAEGKLLPDASPEPPSLLQLTQQDIKDEIEEICRCMLEAPAGLPCTEYGRLTYLRVYLRILGFNAVIAATNGRYASLTDDDVEEMAEAFGF